MNPKTKLKDVLAVQSPQAAQDASFIIDSLGIGIWKWDLITNSLEWDKNMYQLYGADPKDFTGAYEAWESSLSAETKAKAVEEINIAVLGGKSFDTTFQVVHRKTGKVQEIRTRAFLIRDDAGKPIKMWGINIDRTREAELELALRKEQEKFVKNSLQAEEELKRALSSLEKTSKFLEQTGELAKVGGWELDLKTGQVHMTRQTQILHEIDETYVPPQYSTGDEWYPPEAWPTIHAAVKAAIESGIPYDLESPFITAKGRRIWVRVQGFPVKENGKTVSLRGTFQDISERKQAEDRLNIEMQRSIRQSKLASLGEMSAGIAHEINNPLTIIAGTLNILAKCLNNPEKFQSKIQVLKKSCERISKIVSGLKKFSRSGDKIETARHSLNEIVKEVMVLTDLRSKRHSVQISLKLDTESSITCNEIEIEQVLVNLINNAIDAVRDLPEKWIEVAIFEEGESVVLRVMDSGKGIPESVRAKLFEPFFTTKSVGEGTGLGLSIAKGILDEHRATISVKSDCPNTCFELRFPKADTSMGTMKSAA